MSDYQPKKIPSGNRQNPSEWISIQEAAHHAPYSQEYLSLLARRGKIFAKKIGRNWYTTHKALERYISEQALLSPIAKQFNSTVELASAPSNLMDEFKRLNPQAFGQEKKQELGNVKQGIESASSVIPNVAPVPVTIPTPTAPVIPENNSENKVLEKLDRLSDSLETFASSVTASIPAITQANQSTPSTSLNPEVEEFVQERINSSIHRFRHFDRFAKSTTRSPVRLMTVMITAIVLIFVLIGGFSFGKVDAIAQKIKKAFSDATTIDGHFAGTHANEVLVLDKAGNISIYGHIETEGQFRSHAPDGVAPIVVDSMTKVENLNADYIDNLSSQDFTLAFVTKNGNLTYEDVHLMGDVEVGKLLKVGGDAIIGKTLTVSGATKLMDSLTVYGKLGVLSDAVFGKDVTLTNGDLVISKGTIKIYNMALIKNLNAEYLDGIKKGDINLQFVTDNGDTTTDSITVGGLTSTGTITSYGPGFFNSSIWSPFGSFGDLGVGKSATFGDSKNRSNSKFEVYSSKFTVDGSGNVIASGNTTIGGMTTTGSLLVQGSVFSNLIASGSYDLGSSSRPWANLYVIDGNFSGDLTVSGSLNFAGTTSSSFVINTDNIASDSENSYLAFSRGLISPDARITWDTASKQFNFNEPVNISSGSFTVSVGPVGIGTTAPVASALLDLNSTTRGFLAPRMTQAQRDAISSPASGLLIFNTDTSTYNAYNGATWLPVGALKTKEGFTTIQANSNTLTFSPSGFTVTASGSTDTLVGVDYDNGPASRSIAQSITGLWTFVNGASVSTNFEIGGYASIGGNVTVGGNSTLSGLLSFSGTNHAGLKLNNLTTVQRDLLTPASGMTLFNTTVTKMQVYNGTSWKNVGNPEIGAEVTSGTAGSVLFVDGSGNLGQDNNNFYWDVTNARLGIGTSAPTTKFEVQGTASASYGLFGTLQVGGFSSASYNRFGTTTTGHALSASNDVLISGKLEVDGSTYFDGGTTFGAGASISGNFDPSTDNQYDLGDPNYRWRTGYFGTSIGINNGGTLDTTFEVGGTASISNTLTLGGIITSTNTGSNSFSGSINLDKGLHATGNVTTLAQFLSSGTGSNSFAGSLDLTKGLRSTNITATSGLLTNSISQYNAGPLTINAFTLGGLVTGNNQSITGLNNLGFTNASGSGSLELTSANSKLAINAGNNSDSMFEVGGTASISGTTTLAGQTYTWPSSQTANGFLKTNGSGTLSWSTAFAGTIASLSQNFDPATDNQYDLGDSNYRWRTGYFGTSLGINNGGTLNTTLEVGGTASISNTLTLGGIITSANTGSNSFSGSIELTKGFRFGNLTQTGTGVNYFAGNVGIGTTSPTSRLNLEGGRLEVGGTASASYFLTGNTIQVGGFSSVSYNRFGTGTTNHANYVSASNDLLVSGDLEILGTASFEGNVVIGATSTTTLAVGSTVKSDLIPFTNAYNLGSTTNHWGTLYVDTANITTLEASTASISGTTASDFLVNSNNVSNDAEDMSVTFKRGSPTVNAALEWDSTNKRFNLNFPIFVQTVDNPEPSYNFTQLVLKGATDQGSNDYFQIKNSSDVSKFRISDNGASFSVPFELSSTASISNTLYVQNNGNLGIGTTNPLAKLDVSGKGLFTNTEVQGTASASYGLFGTLQIAGFSSTSYSRFGTDTTGHSLTASDDLLISGLTEFNDNAFFDGKASISGNFQTEGRFIFGDNGDTGEINTSDWDISNTGVLTGISGITTDGGYTQSGISNNTLTGKLFGVNAEFQGTASASYGLFGTLQVGGFSSSSYNRFGTGTTGHALSASNDVLISGKLEVDGQTYFDGGFVFAGASVSGNFDPATDNLYDLGDPNYRWRTGYFGTSIGINNGGTLDTKLEVGGTASASYLLSSNTLQVGGFATTSYSRFGTGTTSEAHYITGANDLFITEDLEVNGSVSFAGPASISNTLYVSTLGRIGNVGIGNSTPDQKLDVTGNITASSSGNVDFILRSSTTNSPTNNNDSQFTLRAGSTSERFEVINGNGSKLVQIASAGGVNIVGVSGQNHLSFSSSTAPTTNIWTQYLQESNYRIYENATGTGDRFTIVGTTGSVGIGSTAPSARLDIVGDSSYPNIALFRVASASGTAAFYITKGSNVGIGTSVPSYKLDVIGDINIPTGSQYKINGVDQAFDKWSAGSGNDIYRQNGFVGIGTTAPSTKFEVQGTASASYGLFGTLQIGGFSSTSYNRFGTDTTSHAGTISDNNDLLVSGGFEVNGSTAFDGFVRFNNTASISGNFGPTTDNTYKLGSIDNRWKSINVGPGSFDITSTTGTSGAGANYTLGQITFGSGSSLSFGTYDIGSGNGGSLEFKTASTSRMYISGAGNVGIGTTGPGEKLEVFTGHARILGPDGYNASNEEAILFLGDQTGSNDGKAGIAAVYESGLRLGVFKGGGGGTLGTNSLDAVTILEITGNVGIGTTAPIATLDIEPVTTFTGPLFRVASSSNEALRITSAGNVGIGTTNPLQALTVVGQGSFTQAAHIGSAFTTTDRMFEVTGNHFGSVATLYSVVVNPTYPVTTTNAAYGEYLVPSTAAGSYTLANAYSLYVDATGVGAGSTITNNYAIYSNSGKNYFGGNVGIGDTTPSYQLELSTDSAAKPTSTLWTVPSDARIKTDINDFNDGLATILNIRPVTYRYNGLGGPGYDDTIAHIGVIAQELEPVAPYMVETRNGVIGGVVVNDFKSYQGHALPFLLVNAVKELNAEQASLSYQFNLLSDLLHITDSGASVSFYEIRDIATTLTREVADSFASEFTTASLSAIALATAEASIGTLNVSGTLNANGSLCLGGICKTEWFTPSVVEGPFAPIASLSNYALLTDIPNVSGFATTASLSDVSADVMGIFTSVDSLSNSLEISNSRLEILNSASSSFGFRISDLENASSSYATRTELAERVTQSQLTDALANLVYPEFTEWASSSIDLSSYALLTDLSAVALAKVDRSELSLFLTSSDLSSLVSTSSLALTLSSYAKLTDLSAFTLITDNLSSRISALENASSSFSNTISSDIFPNQDNLYNIGSPTQRLANIYAKYLHAGDLVFSETTSAITNTPIVVGEMLALYASGSNGGTSTAPIHLSTAIGSITGNIGIGTTTANSKLEVSGSIRLTNGSGGSIIFADGTTMSSAAGGLSGANSIGDVNMVSDTDQNGSGTINFVTGASSKMTILNNGNVGIGTSNPAYAFEVSGTGRFSGNLSFGSSASISTNFEVGGYASIGGNITTKGTFASSNTGSSSFAGSLDLSKGLHATGNVTTLAQFLSSGTGSNSFAGSLDITKGLRAANFTQVGTSTNYFNGNVGIGTTSPTALTHLVGDTATLFNVASGSNSRFVVLEGGNVGIGITSPQSTLHVSSSVSGEGKAAGITIRNTNATNGDFAPIWFSTHSGETPVKAGIGLKRTGLYGAGDLYFAVNSTGDSTATTFASDTKMVIQGGGNVGIGTTNPAYKLAVKSGATSSGVIEALASDDSVLWNVYETAGGDAQMQVRNAAGTSNIMLDANGVSYFNGGNLGIGTTNPGSLLHIEAASPTLTAKATTTTSTTIGNKNNRLLLLSDTGTVGAGGEVVFALTDTDVDRMGAVGMATVANGADGGRGRVYIATKTNNTDSTLTERLSVLPDGNVGIGTTGPGATLELRQTTGNNKFLSFTSPDVAHGMTALAPTDMYGYMFKNYNTSGGLTITGLTDADGGGRTALALGGVMGEAAPTTGDSWVVEIMGSIKNGTGTADVAATGHLFGIRQAFSGATVFGILGNGNVGIGTTAPEAKLHIGQNDGTTDGVLKKRLSLEPPYHTGGAYDFQTKDDANYAYLTIGYAAAQSFIMRNDGQITLSSYGTGACCADFAEFYPSSEPVEAADVMAVDPNVTSVPATLKKARLGDTLIGIVSTNPAIVIEEQHLVIAGGSESYVANPIKPVVALAGRVPVKVSEENGAIHAGDRLTLSATLPGYAMKQTTAGQSIGIALENSSGTGKVLTFVNLGYNDPTVTPFAGNTIASGSFASISSASFNSLTTNNLFSTNASINTLHITDQLCLGGECKTSWPDTSSFITSSALTPFARVASLSNYALLTDLPDTSLFATTASISNYELRITNLETASSSFGFGISNLSGLVSDLGFRISDLESASSSYALLTDLTPFATTATLSNYVTNSALADALSSLVYPEPVEWASSSIDLSSYALQSDLQSLNSQISIFSSQSMSQFSVLTASLSAVASLSAEALAQVEAKADVSSFNILSDTVASNSASIENLKLKIGNSSATFNAITQDILPDLDNAYSIGSPTRRLSNIYANNVQAGDLTYSETTSALNGATLVTGDLLGLYVSTTVGGTHTVPILLTDAFGNLSGNLGIGTTTANSKLEVNGSIRIKSGSGGSIIFADGTTMSSAVGGLAGASSIGDVNMVSDTDQNGSGIINFVTGSSNKMVILNNGNVGIGTITPAYKFEVVGAGYFSGNSSFGSSASISTNFEVGGYASIGGNITTRGTLVSSNTGSNSFAGSLLISKGLNAQAIVGTSLTINGASNISGNATFDTNTLYIDSTNNRVGILTTTPTTTFEVQGTASASYLLTGNTIQVGGYATTSYSRFGISTTGHSNYISSNNDLLVSGDLEVDGSISAQFASVSQMFIANNTASASAFFRGNGSGGTNQSNFSIGLGNGTERLNIFDNNNSPIVTIASTGYVGIGTTGPVTKLDIWGTAGANDIFNVASSSGTSVLRITKSGNVGIGTTGPGQLLEIENDAASASARFRHASGDNYVDLVADGSGFDINNVDNTYTRFINNGVERLRIQSDGNVGIGTTGPVATLDVQAAGAKGSAVFNFSTSSSGTGYLYGTMANTGASARLGVDNNGGGALATGTLAYATYLGTTNTTALQLGTNAAVGLTLLSGGNVGIGTTGPLAKLQTYGTLKVGGDTVAQQTGTIGLGDDLSATVNVGIFRGTSAGAIAGGNVLLLGGYSGVGITTGAAALGSQGTPDLFVDTAGNVGIGTTGPVDQLQLSGATATKASGTTWSNPSDLRLKENIIAFTDGLNVITKINPVSYSFNGLGGTIRGLSDIGIIAQDIKDIAPYTITTYQAKLHPEDPANTELYKFNASALTFATINAIKELDARISFISSNTASVSMVVDSTGNIGIGTSTPAYKLHVIGDIAGTSFVNISTKTAKKDIEYVDETSKSSILDKLENLKIAKYRYNEESASSPLRLGLIAEEAPSDVLAIGGKGVDIYKLATFTLAGVQELSGNLSAVQAEVSSQATAFEMLQARVASMSLTVDQLLAGQTASSSTSGSLFGGTTISIASGSADITTTSGSGLTMPDVLVGLANAVMTRVQSLWASGDIIKEGIGKTYFRAISSLQSVTYGVTEAIGNWGTRDITIANTADDTTRTLFTGNSAQAADQSKVDLANSPAGENEYLATYGVDSTRGEIQLSGSSQIVAGESRVYFDYSFSSIISDKAPIRVIVTPTSMMQGQLYTDSKSQYGFVIKELNAQDNGTFDWLVIARRKGFDTDIISTPTATPTPDLSAESSGGQATAEVTPEPTPDVTPVPDVTSTPEPTPELTPTPTPTPEITPEATPEPTPTSTPELISTP